MNPIEDLNPDELVALSDLDFQEKIRRHARSKTSDAMLAITDVMYNSDDDQARLIAATKILKIAKAEDEEKFSALPSGISEEVFRIALAGLGQLVAVASSNRPTEVLRDVSPAKVDPRREVIDIPVLPQPKEILDEEEIPYEK